MEHYPDPINFLGPLAHLWTMWFEKKHCFLLRIVLDAQNFKIILKTMAVSNSNHVISEKLGSLIYDFKAYSDDRQIGQAAEALGAKPPMFNKVGVRYWMEWVENQQEV